VTAKEEAAVATAVEEQLVASVYERAEQLVAHNRSKRIEAEKLTPRWIDKGARFWYRVDGPAGHRFVVVDPEAGTREAAFDHAQLAAALAAASGTEVDAAALPFKIVELVDGAIEFDTADGHWRWTLDSDECTRVEDHAPDDPLEARSPDKQWAISLRDHNLWLRSAATGEEVQLTTDGDADRTYAIQPECLNYGALMRQFGLAHLPPIVSWSPDSRRFLTHITDQRGVELAYLVESSPRGGGRPVLHTARFPMPGDEVLPHGELVVFDVESRTAVPAQTEPMLMPMLSPIVFKRVQWAADNSAVYYLEQPRDLRTLWLKRLDAATGEVRTLVEEQGEPRVEPGQRMGETITRVLPSGREILWWSQRDGWGHLYLYDAESGELKAQVTSGEYLVHQILHVDEEARAVSFLASGLVPGDPYLRQVCRANLDGSGFARVTDDDLDHDVAVPENEAYFVDSASSPERPTVRTVRAWDGSVLVELDGTDVSELVAFGWSLPERFCVKAADGETDIYGVLYLPLDFDPSARYPVIDHPYPGPQVNRVPPSFDPGYFGIDAESVAALGFVVVAVDGRGTPGRSKAFHDASYGRYDTAGFLEDHIAALHQLAETRTWLDLDRVGIFGASGGGFATLRAMCAHPDFYKVGISACGNHDQRYYQLSWGETYDGPYDEETYKRSSNVEIADRLEGKLMLIHGEMDDNVYPHQTMNVVDRLIAANKDFELLIVPGAEHLFVGYESYVRRRRWDFLVRHLLGVEPPAGYRLEESPLDFETFAELLG
jgi:dipeptidyl aminopeptidase/acylaminoacyl peptidase